MRGSMRQRRPGVWELRVHLGRDPLTGKVRQRSQTFHGGKRQAQGALAELVADSAEMRAPATEGTVGFLLDEWFSGEVDDWSPTTAKRYRGIIEAHLRPTIGAVELRKLTPKHLDDLYRAMGAEGLAPATRLQTHAVIRRALSQAQRWGWVTANAAASAKRPQVRHHEVEPPTVAEMHRILSAAPTPELAVLWRVKAELGARRGEMCGLRWSDIDWATGVVRIAQSVIHDEGDLLVKDTKTHAIRRVSLDPGVMNLLAEHLLAMEARAAAEGYELLPDGFVWSHEPDAARPWRPDYLTMSWARARSRAGVTSTIRQHDLRHLNATLQMAGGIPLKTIQKRLGHSSSAMLHRVYGHALPADDEVAAELLGRLLGGVGDEVDAERGGEGDAEAEPLRGGDGGGLGSDDDAAPSE
jgi:integrase